MFDFVRNNTRVMLGLLVLLVIPSFIFFGIEGYQGFNSPDNARVASVDGRKITQAEWDAAHRQQVDNLRRQMPSLDPALFDKPESKYGSLEQLVRERVLSTVATQQHLAVSDARLQQELLSIPQLASLRKPDGSIDVSAYRALLSAQGYTPESFEAGVRQDLAIRQVLGGLSDSRVRAGALDALALDRLFQERRVVLQRFLAADQASKVSPTDTQLESYYKSNESEFRTVEQADIEYLVLDAAALSAGVPVAEDDLRKYYEENISRYTRAEERRASHILVKVDAKASADDKAKARQRAEALLAEVRKAPARFAELARTRSEDQGSAAGGGDLDWFARGAMVKPFEDAAFAMKTGEISDLISSEFGLHIIQLNGVRGGERTPFDKVKPEIETALRQQQAQRRYAEAAEQFTNLVYEQSDTLQPAADRLKLTLRRATVTRQAAPGAQGPLSSPKLLAAVFGDEALKNKRNTDAVETGSNQLVSARVVQYKPSVLQPLSEVRAAALEKVRAQLAAERAREEGKSRLAQVSADPALLGRGPELIISRARAAGAPRELIDAVLKADASKLPAVLGVDLGANGYAVVRIDKVESPTIPEDAKTQLSQQLGRARSDAESLLYYEVLKRRLKVEIKAPKPASASGLRGAEQS